MSEPYDTLGPALSSIFARMIAGTLSEADAGLETAALLPELVPTQRIQLDKVLQVLARVDGHIFTSGRPADTLGAVGATAIDMDAKIFWGPKTEAGWPLTGEPFVGATGSAGTITSVTVETLDAGEDVGVVVGGTPEARTLLFKIPRGATGLTGAVGPAGPDTAGTFDILERSETYGITAVSQGVRFSTRGSELLMTTGYFRKGLSTGVSLLALSGMTFTRALAGFQETVAGGLTSFASGVPRVTDKGYLSEPAVTNLQLYSQEADNAAWVKVGGSITADATAAPDGTMTADLFSENSATSAHGLQQNITVVSGQKYTISRRVKYAGRQWVIIDVFGTGSPGNDAAWFDIQNGVKGVAGSNVTSEIKALANGFYRISITLTANASGTLTTSLSGASGDNITANYAGLNGAAFYVWGAMAELGAACTSYVVTTSATVTRPADALHNTVALSAGEDFTLIDYIEFTRPGVTLNRAVYWHDGSDSNRIVISRQTSGMLQVFVTGAGTTTTLLSTLKDGARTVKVVVKRESGTWKIWLDGVLQSIIQPTVPVGALTTMSLGCSRIGTDQLSDTLKTHVNLPGVAVPDAKCLALAT